jgi:hypothetical protein
MKSLMRCGKFDDLFAARKRSPSGQELARKPGLKNGWRSGQISV